MKYLVWLIFISALVSTSCINGNSKTTAGNALTNITHSNDATTSVSDQQSSGVVVSAEIQKKVQKWKFFYDYCDSLSDIAFRARENADKDFNKAFYDIGLQVNELQVSTTKDFRNKIYQAVSFDDNLLSYLIGFYLFNNNHESNNLLLGMDLERNFKKYPENFNKLINAVRNNFASDFKILVSNIIQSIFNGWIEVEYDTLTNKGVDLENLSGNDDILVRLFTDNHGYMIIELNNLCLSLSDILNDSK